MQQYRKLFNISEIEYVTLFMKVWMAFNAWYRKDSPNIKRDQEAIIFYKSNGDIKKYFLILLHEQSHIGINFRTALYDFVELIEKNILQDKIGTFWRYSEDIIIFSKTSIDNGTCRYLSEFQKNILLPVKESEFFSETFDYIYQLRCNLFHGDIDIENFSTAQLIESSYKILYPIMGKIIQDEDEAIQATLDDLKLKKPPMRRILEVYATNSINFQADNFDLAHITDSFYQKITGKSIRELRKDSNIKTSVFHSLSDIQKEKFERLADIIQSISDNFLEENRLMSMDDWKNVFIHL